jgi:hypothetical protein
LFGYFAVLVALLLTLVAPRASATTACTVSYALYPQSSTAFGAGLTITNTGTTAWTSWTLTWSFANGQTISSIWNATETQSGAVVTAKSESYNGAMAAGASYSGVGFDGLWNGVTNAVPTNFAINGTACAAGPGFTLTSSASSLTILQGASATTTITVTDTGGFTGAVTLVASGTNGLPGGVTAAFSVNPATSTSVLTLKASASAVAGTSTITVSGTSSSGTVTASVNLTLTVNTAGSFTLTPSPTTLQVLPGYSSTDTITIADVSPFAGNVLLSASGLPTGMTASYNTNSATTTGVLTLAAASTTAAGTYPITVVGTSGTLTEKTTISVTVPASPLVIQWISPAAGIAGSSMQIMPVGIGASVGATQGTGEVYFGTTAATVTAWVIDSITVTVPSLAAGTYEVTVKNAAGQTSNALPYTIDATAPSPSLNTGNSTWFSSLGQPYGGCGVPQANLDTQNFVALNVQNTPGNYTTYFPRPITGANLADIGFFDNGANCGRWVHVTIGDFCTGINNGAASYPFCQGADGWVADQFTGADLDMVVGDSCQDGNAWCRDDAYHLDMAQGSLNLFELNGVAVGDMYPNYWQNREIHWYFEEAPNYTGDINIGFITSASVYWGAISITHLQNGIHGVNYMAPSGAWTAAVMDGDLGEDYIIYPMTTGGSQYEIQVYDITNTLINNGRIYSFSFPASCPVDACAPPFTQVTYTTSQ